MLIIDKIITDPNDELFDLQSKYDVRINRSQSSDAVYIFRTRRGFCVRVGHPIPKSKNHIRNFTINIETKRVTKQLVESAIKQYLNRF